MEQLRARATEQKRLKTQILNQTSKLEASFNALYRSCVKLTIYGKGAHSNAVQWQGCGIVVRIYRKDTPRLSLHNKHTDGVVCIGTREAVEGSFIAGHCRVTFYDKNRGVGLDRAGLGPEEFWYNPKIEREKLEALKKKDAEKITHHEHVIMEQLEKSNSENSILNFSCTYVPLNSRPKSHPIPAMLDLTEWVSDVSETESEVSDDSSDDEGGGFSLLLDSAILGKGGKGELRRNKKEERRVRRERRDSERAVRVRDREERRAAKQKHVHKKRRKEEKEQRREEERLYEEESLASSEANGVAESRRTSQAFMAEMNKVEGEEEEESDSSEDTYAEFEPPRVEVGDKMELVQYPDVHDNHHPTRVTVKVWKIEGAKLYYRVDPGVEKVMHRFHGGAALLKEYSSECRWRIVGLHVGKAKSFDGKDVMWCHHGFLLSPALRRMRRDVTEMEKVIDVEDNEEKVKPVNYRKMQKEVAKKDLDMIVSAFKAKIGLNRVIVDVGEIDGARARDLLLNAEAGGIHAVITLMKVYDKQLEIQVGAMRVCVRMMLGTHIQHGKYLRQVEAIRVFGDLGIVSHTVMAMQHFRESLNMTKHSLWLLSLMTQNVENARAAGEQGANKAIVTALKSFAVFGKADPQGQKWGCGCVVNMVKNTENRKAMEKEGVLDVVGELMDNSKSVMCDAKCLMSVLGAITELARKPNFPARKTLVDKKVHIVIQDTKTRVEEQREALIAEEAKSHNDESMEYKEREDDEDEIEFKKFTHQEIDLLLEACVEAMGVLSFGISKVVWDQALANRKFEIDWNLLAHSYNLDAFKMSGEEGKESTTIAARAKQWKKKVDNSKLDSMRRQYSIHKPGRRSPSPDNSVNSFNSILSGSSKCSRK